LAARSCDPLVGPFHVIVGAAPLMAGCVNAIVVAPIRSDADRALPVLFTLVV
jgi:hypothetical protein